MGDTPVPHLGIDLDRVDFSKRGRSTENQVQKRTLTQPSNYKALVRHILVMTKEHESFLTFSRQISEVNRILNVKYSSANDIADVVLRDVGLTSKLLKLVNSSFYSHFSNKGVATVSEAMIILGTEEIKLAAASL
ncbi:MAG: HDOD domain-containing protein, partial [Desulfobacteraceae bacterium]|nr:HDOD domain-containing protein [Desulfobacteraceae bacterium]